MKKFLSLFKYYIKKDTDEENFYFINLCIILANDKSVVNYDMKKFKKLEQLPRFTHFKNCKFFFKENSDHSMIETGKNAIWIIDNLLGEWSYNETDRVFGFIDLNDAIMFKINFAK